MIPKSLYQQWIDNKCSKYYRDFQPGSNTKVCNDTWDKIKTIDVNSNWYDLFRKNFTDNDASGQLKGQSRLGSVNIKGETRTYKRGFTMAEYTPFAPHIVS